MTPPRTPALAALVLAVLCSAATARAQFDRSCDSCRSCTEALATAHARIELQHDIEVAGQTACVVLRGDGAVFDAHEHTLLSTTNAPLALRVEAPHAAVRNVHTRGTVTGIEVAAAEVTLYHDTVEGRVTGVRVTAAENLRIVRTTVLGGRVGIAFGDVSSGHCVGPTPVRSPGAVVVRSRVERADVGVAACDAIPVFNQNLLLRNGVGLLLGAPDRGAGSGDGAAAPFDACVCAPTLDHVAPGTTLFYTSGCSSCQVHEAWMPDLRASHHDIRQREVGQQSPAAQERFDAYAGHCAPELIDILGVSGCVPNYACVASGTVAKVRSGAEGFDTEASLQSPDDVGRFAESCVAAARQGFHAGHGCVLHQLTDNTICGNRTVDIRAAAGARRFGGLNNACATVDGWADGTATGCSAHCPSSLPEPPSIPRPAAATPEPAPAPPPPAPPAEPPPSSGESAAPTEPTAPPPPAPDPGPPPAAPGTSLGPRQSLATAPSPPAPAPAASTRGNSGSVGWVVACVLALGGFGAGLAMGRKRPPGAGS